MAEQLTDPQTISLSLIDHLRPIVPEVVRVIAEHDAEAAELKRRANLQLASILGLGLGPVADGAKEASPQTLIAAPESAALPRLEAAPAAAETAADAGGPAETPAAPEAKPGEPATVPKLATVKPKTAPVTPPTSKKNTCVDCGAPCMKERCQKHASTFAAAQRRAAKGGVTLQSKAGMTSANPAPLSTPEGTIEAAAALPVNTPEVAPADVLRFNPPATPEVAQSALRRLREEITFAQTAFTSEGGFDLFSDLDEDGETVYFAISRGAPQEQGGNVKPVTRFIRRGNGDWGEIDLKWHMRKAARRG